MGGRPAVIRPIRRMRTAAPASWIVWRGIRPALERISIRDLSSPQVASDLHKRVRSRFEPVLEWSPRKGN